MYCGKCGSQMPDDAIFCPVCGGRNADSGAQPLQSHTFTPPPVYSQPNNNYSPVQAPDRSKNKTVLIIVISIIAVLLIVGIIATMALVRRLRDSEGAKETTRRTRQTTTEAVIGSVDTSESTEETTLETEPTTVPSETTFETTATTEPTETPPLDVNTPGLVPDYIWEYADFDAELAEYAGHYKGYVTTSVSNLDQIYIFQDEARYETIADIIASTQNVYFTDLFIDEVSLEAFSDHPLSAEDGTFLYFNPFELMAGGYFEEYSNPNFDGTDVAQYGFVQTAFYQMPGGPPSFYLLNYEEYIHNGQLAYFEVRIDVELVTE